MSAIYIGIGCFGGLMVDRDIIETKGVLALQRLLEVANRSSGQQ